MTLEIERDKKYLRSNDVVFREVDGEIVIVPRHSGISAEEDVLFTITGTGKLIWSLLDGTNTVQQVIDRVVETYDAPEALVAQDVVPFLEQLVSRRMIAI